MRELHEIQKDIFAVEEKMKELREKKESLRNEKLDYFFAEFCEKYGVKKGDVVRTKNDGDCLICDIERSWDIQWIKVRKMKKDGTPHLFPVDLSQDSFEGCTVLRHIDEKEL